MRIGVLTAMAKEHACIAALLEEGRSIHDVFDYTLGHLGGGEVVLQSCGIGKVNAAVGTSELIRRFSPQCVISTGVAGGVSSAGVGVLDVVVGARVVQHDVALHMGFARGEIEGQPRFFEADAGLLSLAMSLGRPSLRAGLICTGDQFITEPGELRSILDGFPDALAVDMESCAIAQTCYLYGVPFLSMRVISDTPGVPGHQEQYEDFWGEMATRSFGTTRAFLEALSRGDECSK